MPRGGKRPKSGAKSLWSNSPTKLIRVPELFAEDLVRIARILDRNESLDSVGEILNSLVSTANLAESFMFDSTEQPFTDDMVRKLGIEGLYYITHIDNIPSILDRGVLSHSEIEKQNINPVTIYNSQIINKRKGKFLPSGKSLWDYANLYFQPRNAMLYSLVRNVNIDIENLVIVSITKLILKKRRGIYVSDGNAAHGNSNFYSLDNLNEVDSRKIFSSIRGQIDTDWWKPDDGSKRKIMAECLVPKNVAPGYVNSLYVSSDKSRDKINSYIIKSSLNNKVNVAVEPKRFFQPHEKSKIGRNISLIKGDLFFSNMQTLTISVNCVGIMGKGLASTAKYRFPDMYVRYEDLCKRKRLDYGSPFVYKRESSTFQDLSDDFLPLENIDDAIQTWFLLFPTKKHWKNKSSFEGIERGLAWVLDNYQKQGIESLAMPALGCGNGGLDWADIGPLMCKYLSRMKIQVAIYLPTEKSIPQEQLSNEFLLSAF